MEHFAKPVNSLNEIAKKIRPRKYLLVEVPGIFADKPYSYYPIWHFQKAHVYNFFYKEYLEVFFSSLGFEILYGDERCTFVLRKGKTHSLMTEPVYDEKLRNYPTRIENYLKKKYVSLDYFKFLNGVRVNSAIRIVLGGLPLLEWAKNIYKKLK